MTTRSVLLGDVRRLQHLLESPNSTDEEINNAVLVLKYDLARWRDADPPSWHQREAGGLASGVAIALFISCMVTVGALLS